MNKRSYIVEDTSKIFCHHRNSIFEKHKEIRYGVIFVYFSFNFYIYFAKK